MSGCNPFTAPLIMSVGFGSAGSRVHQKALPVVRHLNRSQWRQEKLSRWRVAYPAVNPPSLARMAPLMFAASSLATKANRAAICSGVARGFGRL
ncbi:hypothetical protein Ga0074812_115153 [Parafrankia irregularis]|uniref:Uncharacterized protein n=1 Tax=Parafrankia irregularis TaxID=795642 RepID=A0A0S4QS54_9ACTN|nr:hypothetical protein Ga0074812_115153 [Parafrankia irregularis]